jgi:hypothetical protein
MKQEKLSQKFWKEVDMELERPNFGPMFIDVPNGFPIENPQRERNAISYLLRILEVKKRGEYIIGRDGGPGMDTLEGAAFRVAKLVDKLSQPIGPEERLET